MHTSTSSYIGQTKSPKWSLFSQLVTYFTLFHHVHVYTPSCSARMKAADEKFVKLREVYQKLRGEHITLLRTNGDNQKKLLAAEKAKMDAEGESKVGHIWR